MAYRLWRRMRDRVPEWVLGLCYFTVCLLFVSAVVGAISGWWSVDLVEVWLFYALISWFSAERRLRENEQAYEEVVRANDQNCKTIHVLQAQIEPLAEQVQDAHREIFELERRLKADAEYLASRYPE